MPRGIYLNLTRHAVTLPHGQQLGIGEQGEADPGDELQRLVDAGNLMLLEYVQPETPETSAQSLPDEGVLGQSTIQQGPPPEQPVEPSPRGEALEERDKTNDTRRRTSGRKGGDGA